MFMKPLLAIALACVLLVCPLRCAIGGCQDVAFSEGDSSHCACCLPVSTPDREGSPNPDLPDSSCDCESCVCDGAIPPGNSFRDGSLIDFVLDYSQPIPCWAMPAPASSTPNYGSLSPFPNRFQGDTARVALSCWIL